MSYQRNKTSSRARDRGRATCSNLVHARDPSHLVLFLTLVLRRLGLSDPWIAYLVEPSRERQRLPRSGSLPSFRRDFRSVLADFYDDFSAPSREQRMSTTSNLRACRSKTWEFVARHPERAGCPRSGQSATTVPVLRRHPERARRPRSRQNATTVPVLRRHPERAGCPRPAECSITFRNCSMLNDPIDD